MPCRFANTLHALVVMVGMGILLLLGRHSGARVFVDHDSVSLISRSAWEKTTSKSSVCRYRPVSPDHADDHDDEECQHDALDEGERQLGRRHAWRQSM